MKCPACEFSFDDDRLCPKCQVGRLRVRTLRRVGDSQELRLVCTNPDCDHKKTALVPRQKMWSRRRCCLLQ